MEWEQVETGTMNFQVRRLPSVDGPGGPSYRFGRPKDNETGLLIFEHSLQLKETIADS